MLTFGSVRRRSGFPAGRGLLVVLVALAALGVLALGLGLNWALRDDAGRTPSSQDSATFSLGGLPVTQAGDDWTVSAGPGPAWVEGDVAMVRWYGPTGEVLVVAPDGSVRARIQSSYAPLALLRSAAHELVVSDVHPNFESRLLVFDTRNGLTFKREIAIPNRAQYTLFAPTMWVLSRDQRFLYYLRQGIQDTPACAPTEPRGEECAWFGVGVVDLASTDSRPTTFDLPNTCVGRLGPSGEQDAIVACADSGEVYRTTPSQLVKVTSVDRLLPQLHDVPRVGAHAAVVAAYGGRDGAASLILSSGDLIRIGPDGTARSIHVAPDGQQLLPTGLTPDDRGFVFLSFRQGYADMRASSGALVDLERGVVIRRTDEPGDYFARLGGERSAILDGNALRLRGDTGFSSVLRLPDSLSYAAGWAVLGE